MRPYLLYFVQFLRDLGVDATSDLKHQAGQVLFTVTPSDEKEALDKIQMALSVYLNLPSSPIADLENSDIAVQRLAANIDHLKGQLRLSKALAQANEATIEAQQFTIQQQRRLLSNKVLTESIIDVQPLTTDSETENFLGGTFKIKKYEGKGFDVDLPEIFRRLKQLFKKR